MRLGRSLPELPADLVFETDEWQAAYVLNKKKPPKTPPSLNAVVRLIAQLGGFLGRKSDGEPPSSTLATRFAATSTCLGHMNQPLASARQVVF